MQLVQGQTAPICGGHLDTSVINFGSCVGREFEPLPRSFRKFLKKFHETEVYIWQTQIVLSTSATFGRSRPIAAPRPCPIRTNNIHFTFVQCSSALLPVEGGRRSEEQGSRSLLTSQRFFSSPFPQTRVIRTHSATVLTRRRRRHPLFGPRNICVDNLSRRLARRGRSSSSQGLKVDAYRRFFAHRADQGSATILAPHSHLTQGSSA